MIRAMPKIYHLLGGVFFVSLLAFVVGIFSLRFWIQRRKLKIVGKSDKAIYVGIFHPYCNAGGGGERVLWCAVRALQAKYDNVKIVIYTGDVDSAAERILEKAFRVFNIKVDKNSTSFVFLRHRSLVEASKYPYCTLLGQSIGSILLGLEALWKYPPDVYIDTMGYAFTLPLFRFFGNCKIGCYVHYPTISSDMLRRVQQRRPTHNNQGYVTRNPFLTWLKLLYYNLFSKMYSWAGRSSDTIMVNSSWTENHILELWKAPFKTHRVYPPCDTSHIKTFTADKTPEDYLILSVGQFRPEKDHPLQLQALYELRTLLIRDENIWNRVRLIMVGSCRNEEDYDRLKNIQDLSKHLSLENSVEFKVNISYNDLLDLYRRAKIGIHTMWNEHFGIGIVECMAAGMIMIAHRSGGPLLDIVETSEGSQNGYLAADAMEFADCICSIINNSKEDNSNIVRAAVSSVERFSEAEFEVNFLRAVTSLFSKEP